MKVRIFVPTDKALEPFAFGDFEFAAIPREGQILRFTELENADYPIEQVGEGETFIAAVCLGSPRPRSGTLEGSAEAENEVGTEVSS